MPPMGSDHDQPEASDRVKRAQYTAQLMDIQKEFIMLSPDAPAIYMDTVRSFGVNPQDTTPNLEPGQFDALIANLRTSLARIKREAERDPGDGP